MEGFKTRKSLCFLQNISFGNSLLRDKIHHCHHQPLYEKQEILQKRQFLQGMQTLMLLHSQVCLSLLGTGTDALLHSSLSEAYGSNPLCHDPVFGGPLV